MPETQGMWVQSLAREDPLGEEIATHSSVLAWKKSMDRGAWRATVHGVAKSQTQLGAHTHVAFPVSCTDVSWTTKKIERQRTDAFKLWCWRRLSRAPWTARRSSQPVLKEVSPECSLEGLKLKLKLSTLAT